MHQPGVLHPLALWEIVGFFLSIHPTQTSQSGVCTLSCLCSTSVHDFPSLGNSKNGSLNYGVLGPELLV